MHSHPNARLTQKARLRLRDPAPGPRPQHHWVSGRERHQPPLCLPLAGSLRLRCSSLSGGSRECQSYPSADAGSAACSAPWNFATSSPIWGRSSPRISAGSASDGLRNLELKPSVQRFEWERPGDLIYIDVKSLSRFRNVGHRSPESGSWPDPIASAMTRSMSPWMSPKGRLMLKFWRTRKSQRRSAFSAVVSPGSMTG
jgi:hypothetical protein